MNKGALEVLGLSGLEGYVQIVEGRLSSEAVNKLNKEFEDNIKNAWDEIPEEGRKALQYHFELPKPQTNYIYLALSGSYKSKSSLDFFDTVFCLSNIKENIEVKFIRLLTFKPQLVLSMDSADTDKSICLFCFLDPIPDLILHLPVLEGWTSSAMEHKLCICQRFIWDCIVQNLV